MAKVYFRLIKKGELTEEEFFNNPKITEKVKKEVREILDNEPEYN